MALLQRFFGILQRHPWRTGIGGVVCVILLSVVAFAMRTQSLQYVTAQVERTNIRQTVEAVGTVMSERDLKLQFPTSGIVAGVAVQQGDRVRAGQRLAWLRAGDAAATVGVQAANLRSAQAQLQALQEGARPEDIAIAQADVANKRASLEAVRASLLNAEDILETSQEKLDALVQEANTVLIGQRSVAQSAAAEQIAAAQSSLTALDAVCAKNDLLDAIIKADPGRYALVHAQRLSVGTTLSTLRILVSAATGNEQVALSLQQVRSALSTVNLVTGQGFDLVSSLPASGYFTQASKDTSLSTLDQQRAKLQGAMTALDAATKSLSDAAAGFTTRIAAERSVLTSAEGAKERAQADIRTFETALLTAQAQLALKAAPSRPTDLAAAAARVEQAAAEVRRVQALYANTILTAPIGGVITQVNVKLGEALPAGAAVTMLGTSPYQIAMFVSEIDVPKVQMTQSGSIELDAFPGVHVALRVSAMDAAPTEVNGVAKYRVKLDFVHPHDELRIGMSGDAEIITGERTNVLTIPARAVLENDESKPYVRVLKEDATVQEKPVTPGMEGGDLVEIIEGLREEETIIVLIK